MRERVPSKCHQNNEVSLTTHFVLCHNDDDDADEMVNSLAGCRVVCIDRIDSFAFNQFSIPIV